MTIIKKLKLRNFKSFAKPTELEFGPSFNIVIGPNGSGKCVTGNTLVQLADGRLVQIGNLVEEKLNTNITKKIDDGFVAIGDDTDVAYLNIDNLKIGKKKILAYVKRKSPDKLIRITTRSGRSITSTTYHPLFILKDGKVISTKAENLKVGTRIAVPRNINIDIKTKYFFELLDLIRAIDKIYVPYNKKIVNLLKKHKTVTWKEFANKAGIKYIFLKGLLDKQAINFEYIIKLLRYIGIEDKKIITLIKEIKSKNGNKLYNMLWKNSKEFSRFLGYLLSEGQMPIHSDQIRLTNGCDEIVADYKKITDKLFNVNCTINEYKPNCYDVLFYSEPIRKILSKFGMPFAGTEYKDLTNLFLSHSSNEELAEFFNGLYSGDGYINKNYIELTTKSKKLGFAIENILTRLGITFVSKFKVKIATNSGFSGIYKVIVIYGNENLKKFNELIKLKHPDKLAKLENIPCIKINPNIDLLEVNSLVKSVAKELKLNIKKLKKEYPKLNAYVYNQCLPSRNGVNQLISQVFLDKESENIKLLRNLANSDILWDEIIEVEDIISKEEWVYDLCVEGDHNFIANNIIIHNSNIMDALCFVLGKSSAKSMRAEKSANLIYNGGKKGNPAKEASVSIVFDNSKGIFPIKENELEITRIVRQNGNSIYKINDETRTRQQILDVLSKGKIDPEGHNIILQGDIAHFMEMKPEERREIIEQIAGISVYEDKKQKAMLELEKVDSKLNEATIILTERDAHLREIKKDHDQAMQYKDIESNIKSNKATIFDLLIKEKETKKSVIESKINDHKSIIEKLSLSITNIREDINAKKDEINAINKELEEKGEVEQINLNREITDLKTDIVKSSSRLETLKSEIEKIKARKLQLNNDVKELDEKILSIAKRKKELESKNATLQNKKARLKQEIDSFKDKHGIENIKEFNEKLDAIEKELEESSITINNLQSNKQIFLGKKDNLSYKLRLLEESISKAKNLRNNPELENLRQEFKKSTLELSKLSNEDAITQSQLNKARSKLLSINDEFAKLRARNISIIERNESNAAIKKILSLKDKGIYGTISQLGKVDNKYALALEVAAGNRINSIVTDDDITAAKCIKLLKDEKLGIATFLPLNKLRSREAEPSVKELASSTHGFAINLISFDKKFKDAFWFVFGSTIVVDNIDSARKIGIGRARMVTIDGDLVETSGAMHGGYRKHVPSFKEKDTDVNIANLEKEISRLKETIDLLSGRKIEIENNLSSLKQRKSELEGSIIRIESSSNIENLGSLEEEKLSIQEDLSEINNNVKDIDKEVVKYIKELDDLKSKKQSLKDKLMKSKDVSISDSIDKLENERQSITEETIKNESEIRNIESQASTLYSTEKEKIKQIISQHDKELLSFTKELEDLNIRLKEQRDFLKDKEAKEKQFYSDFRQLSIRRNKITEEMQNRESLILKEESKIKEIEYKINDISLDRAKIIGELEGLNLEFEQYKEDRIRKNISIDELKEQTKKLEKTLQSLGTVNMRAIEIYDDLKREHENLLDKVSKLKIEKEDVLKMMYEIEQKKKDIFMSTYKELEKNFTDIFSNLSKKGQAYLHLENIEDPLSAGLDIIVKLTGEKKLDIRSLSGGEKTLAALAFIFAIQEHSPASFYFLDEVDAALDKINSELLSKQIAKYSKHAQYIVISHNDAVISEAELIYGVSMQHDGISKIVSLKI